MSNRFASIRSIRGALVVAVLALPVVAWAQPAPPDPYGAPPPGAPAPENAPPPGYPMPPPVPMAAPPEPEPTIRIRAGAGGAVLMFVPGISYGANFSGRIGIQIKKLIGVYADLGGGLGFGGSIGAGAGGGGVSIDFVDFYRLGVMGEIDLGPFFVSAGLSLFKGVWGGVSEFTNSMGSVTQAAYVAAGYFPAVMSRIGVSLGHSRSKFTIALENMLVFGSMTEVSQNASQQGAEQSVKIGNRAVGWQPALMFGWDLR